MADRSSQLEENNLETEPASTFLLFLVIPSPPRSVLSGLSAPTSHQVPMWLPGWFEGVCPF